jgi:hypothetical protein
MISAVEIISRPHPLGSLKQISIHIFTKQYYTKPGAELFDIIHRPIFFFFIYKQRFGDWTRLRPEVQ